MSSSKEHSSPDPTARSLPTVLLMLCTPGVDGERGVCFGGTTKLHEEGKTSGLKIEYASI